MLIICAILGFALVAVLLVFGFVGALGGYDDSNWG